MLHGTQGYFLERARCARRNSLASLLVALALLATQELLSMPPVRHRLARIDPQRFGLEGPERYVRRILLESIGPLRIQSGRDLTMVQQQSVRGGAAEKPRSTSPGAEPETRDRRPSLGDSPEDFVSTASAIYRSAPGPRAEPETRDRRPGIGDSPADLVSMARAIYRSAPVVQSEDLVIERLVKPRYPEEARQRDIEGKVALVALVDTTGRVASVDIMASTGERELEKAATEAVWQCRFRPYRVKGDVREVYAVFRFAFRIY